MEQTTLSPPVEKSRALPAAQPLRQLPPPRSSRRVWWLLAVLLVAAIAIWVGASIHKKSVAQNAPKGPPPPIPVTATQAHSGDIGVYYDGLGAVTPVYTVTVHTRVDGQLMQVYYREGQLVKKGERLVEIDPRPYEAALNQAQGQLLRDQATLANARVDLNRYQELIKRNAVAEQTLATQLATVKSDEGIVKNDEGTVAAAAVNVAYCHIASPITGRVGLRLVDPGNIVHAADTNGMLVIAQIQPITVIFTIAEDQLPPLMKKMQAGRPLEVDAYDRDMKVKIAQGKLLTIDNQIDPTTGTVKLRAQFENKDNSLFPNQFVNARLLLDEKRGVTLVSNAAVQRNAQSTYAYLVKPDHTVTVRQVTLGTTEGGQTEITSGVAPGDVLVTAGVDKLVEGSRVNPTIKN